MSAFLISQLLVAIAIGFDLLSFQFKQRRRIVACLCCAGVLISLHFALLQQWTAASLMALASIRYLCSFFTTSRWLLYLFCGAALAATGLTYAGPVSLVSCLGSTLQSVAAFNRDDRRLREIMLLGTACWLLHNALVGSPIAVVMELLFIGSNLLGYYRYYLKPRRSV